MEQTFEKVMFSLIPPGEFYPDEDKWKRDGRVSCGTTIAGIIFGILLLGFLMASFS